MQYSKRGGMPCIFPESLNLGSLVRCHPVGTQLSATSASGRPSRFAGGQRAARCLPSVFRSRSGASSQQAWAFHAGWIESLGFEARVGNRALGVEHFSAHPVSKHLSSQCVVMKEQFQFKRLSPRLARPSKVARFVVTPPPNPSFKRTRLRRSA